MSSKLNQDLLLLWLSDNAERCRTLASRARRATRRPSGYYGAACVELAAAHDAAAEVYESAADAARSGARSSGAPTCTVARERIDLALTNGAGVLLVGSEVFVVDADGHAIGAWDLRQCEDLSAHELFRGVLELAARGCPRDEAAPQTKRSAS
jgi:hypothetical protein